MIASLSILFSILLSTMNSSLVEEKSSKVYSQLIIMQIMFQECTIFKSNMDVKFIWGRKPLLVKA